MGESLRIIKTDDDQRLVFGWASVVTTDDGSAIVDSDGDIIEPEELEKAAYDYVLKARQAGERHQGDPIGEIVESVVFTPSKAEAMGIENPRVGWWIGVKVHDSEAFQKVKDGEYKMFSIEGTATSVQASTGVTSEKVT